MCPKDADGMAVSVDPDQISPIGAGSALSVPKLRIIMVLEIFIPLSETWIGVYIRYERYPDC